MRREGSKLFSDLCRLSLGSRAKCSANVATHRMSSYLAETGDFFQVFVGEDNLPFAPRQMGEFAIGGASPKPCFGTVD